MTEHKRTPYGASTTVLEPWLTVNEVARVLRRSRGFIYELVHASELHPVRVGQHMRFDPDDIRSYLERLREADAP